MDITRRRLARAGNPVVYIRVEMGQGTTFAIHRQNLMARHPFPVLRLSGEFVVPRQSVFLHALRPEPRANVVSPFLCLRRPHLKGAHS